MRTLLPLVVLASALGCAMPDGMNFDCRWPNEPPGSAPTTQHLADDLEVGEELAIRYADSRGGRQPQPVFGVLVRAGIGPAGNLAALRHECFGRLKNAIAARHNLTLDDLRSAKERVGGRGVDLFVNAPLVVLALVLAVTVRRRIWARFGDDERTARIVVLSGAALAFGIVFVFSSAIWSAAVQILRVGNEHMSSRNARLFWPQHVWLAFEAGLALFAAALAADLTRASWSRTSVKPK